VTLDIARRLPASRRAIQLFAAWAFTATLVAMAFYAWTLHFRVPVPAPIPSWYRAR